MVVAWIMGEAGVEVEERGSIGNGRSDGVPYE